MAARDQSYTSSPANAAGVATITITTDGVNTWQVFQVSVELDAAPVGSTCDLRKNGNLITALIPTGDAADGSPMVLLPTDQATITWSGLTPGQIGNATLMFDDGRTA